MGVKNDTSRLVDSKNGSLSYTGDYEFNADSDFQTNYKTRGRCTPGCCVATDGAALRCIIVWMITVAIVVFVALLIEIVNQDHTVNVGDISTEDAKCTEIGANILKLGGNAVDAAIAAGLCTTVTLPHVASLGGGGVMLIHNTRKNETHVLDFIETVPAGFKTDRLLNGTGTGRGYVGIPGILAGLLQARKLYGSDQTSLDCCKRVDLFNPTYQLLNQGFIPSPMKNSVQVNAEVRRFLDAGGYSNPKSEYTRELRTLYSDIMTDYDSFYDGIIAKQIQNDLKGQISEEDLSNYTVRQSSALAMDLYGASSLAQGEVTKYQILTPGVPFTGVGLLALLSKFGYKQEDPASDFITRVMERSRKFETPQGIQTGNQEPIKLSSASFERLLSTNQEPIKEGLAETGTNILVMDKEDNYVSLTLSMGSNFGSQVFAKGMLMNNALAFLGSDTETSKEPATLRRSVYPVLIKDIDNECGTRSLLGALSSQNTFQAIKGMISKGGKISNTTVNYLGWISLQGDNV